jgi:hypothetical protein
MILGAGASKTVFRNYGSPPSELAEKPTFYEQVTAVNIVFLNQGLCSCC